jgi:hypothetical protein
MGCLVGFAKSPLVAVAFAVMATAIIAAAMVACGGGGASTNVQTGGGGGGGGTATTLPIGTVQNVTTLSTCPAGEWFQYTDSSGTNHPMNCVSATLASCPNVADLAFTYGYLSPAGIITGDVKGVIVYFDGGDGTQPLAKGSPTAGDMVKYYFEQGYELVQIAWSSAWEATYNPFPAGTFGNIQAAACRPATFLSYVDTKIYQPVFQANASAGMCAHGVSAGSTQILYSMTYYGAAKFLDNVELVSGPVFGDIAQGCEEPPASPVTVCPAGQYGCELGPSPVPSWSMAPTYLEGAYENVGSWTNDNSCGVPNTTTSSASSTRWLQQSIVDGGVNSPSYDYPATGMAAWLCRSVQNPDNIDCATNYTGKECANNSSPQAEIFYSQITAANAPPVYRVVAVDNCEGSEGSPSGNVGGPTGPLGELMIEQDMAGAPGVTAQCLHRQH